MRNSLLRNDGDGDFTDVTKAAGLPAACHRDALARRGPTTTTTAGSTSTSATSWRRAGSIRNKGDGTFEDVSRRGGRRRQTPSPRASSWGDYDNDGFPDLYVSNMFGDNFLYHNNGDGTFDGRRREARACRSRRQLPDLVLRLRQRRLARPVRRGYPTSVERVRQALPRTAARGRDAEAVSQRRRRRLHRRHGGRRARRAWCPSMGANFGDIDNDGFLDIYLGTGAPSFAALMPNIMLRNDGGRRFATSPRPPAPGTCRRATASRSPTSIDDGDQDIVLNAGGAVPGDRYDDAVFENPGTPGRHWVDGAADWRAVEPRRDRREDPRHRRSGPRGAEPATPAALSRGVERRLVRLEQLHPARRPGRQPPPSSRSRSLAGEQDTSGVPKPPDRYLARDPGGRRRAGGPTTHAVPARPGGRACA